MDSSFRASPLALAVLSMLVAGPLHPYGIQRLLKHWGKDKVVNIGQRATLYKTIRRLNDAGLITIRQTERDQQYPERTVYELTEDGRNAIAEWLDEMLATPRNEFPQFPAALSFAMLLLPEDVLRVLEKRAASLSESLLGSEQALANIPDGLPRVTLLDDEYQQAMTSAELRWVNGVVDDLRQGRLTWGQEMIEETATAELGDLAKSILPD